VNKPASEVTNEQSINWPRLNEHKPGNRLHHLGRTKQARPELGHPYKQCAVTAAKSKKRWCPPQSNIKLMAEKQILGFKSDPRLEQVDDEHSECVQYCKHRYQ